MTIMQYQFDVTPLDCSRIYPQVCSGMEKRLELESRARVPGIWKKTDQLTALHQTARPKKKRRRMTSALCLLLGIFVLVPGLVRPAQLGILIPAGLLGIAAGLSGFLCGSGKVLSRKTARKLLAQLGQIPSGAYRVLFGEDGMEICNLTDHMKEEVAFCEIEYTIVTEDLYLILYRGKGMILQKDNLVASGNDDFLQFLDRKVSVEQVPAMG